MEQVPTERAKEQGEVWDSVRLFQTRRNWRNWVREWVRNEIRARRKVVEND